jgi:Mrp family chromosome partitioning ATPase
MNKKVLLVDGDRRGTTQNQFYGVKHTIGWQEAVCSEVNIQDVMFQIGAGNLFLWPSSNSSRITAGIFNPQAITALMDMLRAQFDLVVIDSSPLSQSPDGLAIAPHVDGVLLVVEAENTRWRVVENTKNRLKACGANVLGVVFNKRRLHIPSFIYKRLR